ncbi:recombination mediator RecR [Candidatus Parcubacteria bacterium]|nr:recombination mediator RecR [Patescibacteria group bacterium]MCG2686706.1 recombination mediator RecR [Candidatus Parcubacteria bacterium]
MPPKSIQKLITHFNNLPGIGQKTAERLVFYLLKKDKNTLTDFANTLLHIKDNIKNCAQCGQITEQKICDICSDKNRDSSIICVVAENSDISPLEKSGEFKGIYHVLNGVLNPTEGMTPDKLNINKLEEKISAKGGNNTQEIILALNPTIEGETTNLYLTKLLKKYNIKITKLARGLPQGSDLEYADEITLANALRGRTILCSK